MNPPVAESLLSDGIVLLRPVEPSDYPSLRRMELSEHAALSWRHNGIHPSPESYADNLWAGVHTHFLAFDTVTTTALGLLTTYDHNAVDRVACFAAFRFTSDLSARTHFLRAFYLAMRYAFEASSIRKLYLETPEYNYANLASLVKRGALTVEGRLIEHKLSRGRYWDQVILAATPTTLERLGDLIELTNRDRHA